jgi:hypothetical protein
VVLGMLLAAHDTPQASRGGRSIGDFLFQYLSPDQAALIGLGLSLLVGLLGVWAGKTPMGKLGKGALYFLVAVAVLVVAPVLIHHHSP